MVDWAFHAEKSAQLCTMAPRGGVEVAVVETSFSSPGNLIQSMEGKALARAG